MSYVRANIAGVPSTLYDDILVLVTVQQLKCLPNLKDTEQTELTLFTETANTEHFHMKNIHFSFFL